VPVDPAAVARASRYGLRTVALGYLAVLLAAPLVLVFWRTFEEGFGTFWDAITTDAATHALWLTVLIALIAVPLNAVFGVMAALIFVRRRVPGRSLISALIDLPLALSPVVVGLSLILVWGQDGWFHPVTYGAVAVVSGKIAGRTETLTLHVEERFQGFDPVAAYGSSVLLALIALATVLLMNVLNRKGGARGHHDL
jgi:ABC-type sulfate transport system permease subunit